MITEPFLILFGWYMIFGALLRFKSFRGFLNRLGMGEEGLMLFMSKLLLIIGFGGFFVYWLTGNGHN